MIYRNPRTMSVELTKADVFTGVRSARRKRSLMSFSCSARLLESIAGRKEN